MFGLLYIICTGGCGSPFYHWQGTEQRYWVAERGHVLELVAVDVREPYHTPFVTAWHHLLVQPCGKAPVEDGLPCWPSDRPFRGLSISQSELCTLTQDMPGYRYISFLGDFSGRHVPGLDVIGRVLVGTEPLAIACVENPFDGKPLRRNYYAHELGFITSDYLLERAKVVAVFDEGTDIRPGLYGTPTTQPVSATVFKLRQPMPFRDLLNAVGDRAKLEQLSEQVVHTRVGQ